MRKFLPLSIVILGLLSAIMIFRLKNHLKNPDTIARINVTLSSEMAQEMQTLLGSAQEKRVLYTIIKDPNSPMPLGALARPVTFASLLNGVSLVLTQENVQLMRGADSLPELFDLKVRWDQDGQAGSDQPGDLIGEVKHVSMGDTVELQINRRVSDSH